MKLGKQLKYIIFKMSDDYKEIVVEEKSDDSNWETFQNKLLNAKSSVKGKEGKGPRYAVYDFQYELPGGEGTRYIGTCDRRDTDADAMAGTKSFSFRGLQTKAL